MRVERRREEARGGERRREEARGGERRREEMSGGDATATTPKADQQTYSHISQRQKQTDSGSSRLEAHASASSYRRLLVQAHLGTDYRRFLVQMLLGTDTSRRIGQCVCTRLGPGKLPGNSANHNFGPVFPDPDLQQSRPDHNTASRIPTLHTPTLHTPTLYTPMLHTPTLHTPTRFANSPAAQTRPPYQLSQLCVKVWIRAPPQLRQCQACWAKPSDVSNKDQLTSSNPVTICAPNSCESDGPTCKRGEYHPQSPQLAHGSRVNGLAPKCSSPL
ncbi:hypothetical protein BJ878DRAFT_484162 [Calycina marina]|uniref:Uncharacterized protein n=1 Tax=Calycina marina TaxID=1763456 RepID=A0A9P8CAP4_9HELO|nr:hypothetical protein BJ878DRAFT_484162 [Calycina marina]